ncbi:MAG: DUF2791 family P-loop domain-containing protein [Ardenticatenaceae bacterium]|nr:DUF2791 family P-loop domain-containing protein [Ardenticatenaceae bacterium]
MKTFLTSIFVGRREEINQLDAVLNAVQNGVGRCVLVSGEAGIGKSRLLAEVQDRAERAGFKLLNGRCFEQDRSFPYAPLVDMLRPFFAQIVASDHLTALGSLAPEIIKLLPELEPHFFLPLSGSSLDSEIEKRRLFEALTTLFWHQAEIGPLLLVVEDLHWSDQASLEFLLHLVRRIAGRPIALLLTSRIIQAQAGLAELLAGLDREPIAQEIKLNPLDRNEVSQLLKGILNQTEEPSTEFVEAVYTLTEGNPFFAEEICTSLIASGDIYFAEDQWRRKPLSQIDIPDSVQRVVQRRVSHISQAGRQFIDLAAVSGRSFDFAVLQILTGHSDKELLDLIKELLAARLVVEESADRFAFRHALTREALYGRLLARERQALHGQLVKAIEQVHADSLESHLEALAYHAYEAALWPKTVQYARRAGEKALALFAPHAAAEQFSRAIEAAEQLSQASTPALYKLRGQAHDTLGNFNEARADYEAALQAARNVRDQQATWQLLLDLGLLWASRDYERTGDYCQQALDLARTMEDEAAVGHSLNRLGNWLMNSGRASEALDYHREALSLFEGVNDQTGIAKTLDLLAMTSNQSGNAASTVTYYERAIPILRELHDWQTLSSSLANLAIYTMSLEQANEAIKLAHDIGWQSGEAYALNCLSLVLFSRGRYGESLNTRTQSLKLAQAIEHPQWTSANHIYFGFYYIELLALTRAQNHLEAGLTLSKQIGSTFFSWMGGGWLASIYILQGQLEAAETLLAELPQEWIPTLYTLRLAGVELALAQQDATRMLQLLDDLLSLLPVLENARIMIPFLGPVWILHSQALLLLGRLDEAEQVLLQAVELYTKHGIAPGLWRNYIALGKIYLADARTEQAREMFTLARTQITTLGLTLDEEDLRENFLRRALAVIPDIQPPTPRQAAKQEFGGLTRRERQVATVVAQGLTNQEIADELVVSIKTVEAHVTRILSKLGFSSRAQIAAWAVDKGLAAAPQDLDSLSSAG